MIDLLFLEAFTLWGSPATWLEVVAVVLGLILELTGKSGVIPLVVAMVFLIGAFLVR